MAMRDERELTAVIQRIRQMEEILDTLEAALEENPVRVREDPALREMVSVLTRYYEGGEWMADYAQDERGELPIDLKRGVLSEDAVYNLLCDLAALSEANENSCGPNEMEGPFVFREMARKKQQLSEAECIEILKAEPRGVLSVLGDDGYPYGMPLNHWYCEENGRLYFHSGMKGHKVDAIRTHEKVSFCVYDQGFRRDGEWALNIKSVIVFGRIRPVEDQQEAIEIIRKLSFKYTSDSAYIEREIQAAGARTLCLELIPEHMTGKLVNES